MKSNASDSGSSQFEQIDSVNMNDIPDAFRNSIAYRASMTARIGDANDIKTLKQKVKVLKAAVLKEREVKVDMERKIEQLSTSYQDAQKQIEKKDETIIYQEQQLQSLKEKFVQLGNQSNKAKNQILTSNASGKETEDNESFMSSLKQIISFSSTNTPSTNQNQTAEIQKLQKENFVLREEIEKQKMAGTNNEQKIKQEQEEIHKRQMIEINRKMEALNQQTQEFKDRVVDITSQLQQKTTDLKEKEETLVQFRQEINQKNQSIEKMKNELEFTNDKCKKMDSKITQYLNEIETKTNKIALIESQIELLKVDKENLQNQVNSMDEKIMLFTLKKISGLYQDNCQIICRKDLEGQHIIDFDSVKERFTINVLDIRDVICEFDPEPILTLILNKNQQLIFKGNQDLRQIEKKLRQFVMNAPSSKSTTRNTNPQQQNKQDKGLLDNVYSLFK